MRIPSRVTDRPSTSTWGVVPALTLALTLATAAGGASGASPRPGVPAPFGPARNGSLAWGADGDIHVADSDGGNATAIITGPETDVAPGWSHDGTRFAFLRAVEGTTAWFMVARADATGVAPLTVPVDALNWYDWSPDDTRLVIYHQVEGVPSISIVAADGSGMRTLDLGDLEPGGRVDWRPPDGRELILTAHPRPGSAELGLYAVAPDGTGLRRIGDTATGPSPFHDFQVSPDGRTIGYWSWGPNAAGVSDGWAHLRDADTGEDLLIESYGDPRFSPDGESILGGARNDLLIGPATGGTPVRSVYVGQTIDSYDFSPDGRSIIVLAGNPLTTVLVDLATGVQVETLIPELPNWQRLAP